MNDYIFNALMEALDVARHWELRYVLRADEAARYIGIGTSTLRELQRVGAIPFVKMTDHPRGAVGFRRKDLEAYVDNRVDVNGQTGVNIPSDQ
jgi:excisionase family DNA binding protein